MLTIEQITKDIDAYRRSLATIRTPRARAAMEEWMYPYLRESYLSSITSLRAHLPKGA